MCCVCWAHSLTLGTCDIRYIMARLFTTLVKNRAHRQQLGFRNYEACFTFSHTHFWPPLFCLCVLCTRPLKPTVCIPRKSFVGRNKKWELGGQKWAWLHLELLMRCRRSTSLNDLFGFIYIVTVWWLKTATQFHQVAESHLPSLGQTRCVECTIILAGA